MCARAHAYMRACACARVLQLILFMYSHEPSQLADITTVYCSALAIAEGIVDAVTGCKVEWIEVHDSCSKHRLLSEIIVICCAD